MWHSNDEMKAFDNKSYSKSLDVLKLEARVGIEPTIEDLQSSALPLGDRAIIDAIWISRRRSPMSSSELSSNFCFYKRSTGFVHSWTNFYIIVRD